MKVCEICEVEIDGADGENRCPKCEEAHTKKQQAAAKRRANTAARREAMKSLGLVQVRGALGGVYWE